MDVLDLVERQLHAAHQHVDAHATDAHGGKDAGEHDEPRGGGDVEVAPGMAVAAVADVNAHRDGDAQQREEQLQHM